MSNYFRWSAGRVRSGTPVLENQPGAHTGTSRKYIPGYADTNIVYLDTVSGNDANDGSTELLPKLTYASAATAAGSTKKIRVINNGASLTTNITKPTEMERGVSGTISSSLTAPVDTLTMAATPVFSSGGPTSVLWVPKLKKIYACSGAQIASSSDGDTYALESTLTFGITKLTWVKSLQKIVAIGASGKIAYSTDGQSYTEVTLPTSVTLRSVIEYDGKIIVGGDSYYTFFSVNLTEWEVSTFYRGRFVTSFVSDEQTLYAFDADGKLSSSTDGVSWSALSDPTGSGYGVRAAVYMKNLGLIIIGNDDGSIYSSSDGSTFTQRVVGGGDILYDAAYVGELSAIVVCGQSKLFYRSYNGTSYADAATNNYTSGDEIRGVCYSEFLGRVISVGGNTGLSQRRASYSTAFANTISAAVAGFTIQAVQYSGTPTLYNCTMKQPGGLFNTENCRFTESGAHVSGNTQSHFGTLADGDLHLTCIPASQNAVAINANTIAGTLYIYNGTATGYEQIRDNIIEDGIISNAAVTVQSGNTRGTSSAGTIFAAVCTNSDPTFVDTTDYKLQRVLDGYPYDSPLVAAAFYYVNENGDFRDLGAWSYNESTATYKYTNTDDFPMPSAAVGGTFDVIRHNRANLHVAEDGTPDTTNTPESRWEEIILTYKTVPERMINFIALLESGSDMTSNVSFDPSTTPTTSLAASGATSAGEAVITVADNSGVDSGDRLTFDGNTYTVLYTYGSTKIVLNRITTTALSDMEAITVAYDTGFGEYQYIPQTDRKLTRWYETDTSYQRGLVVRFARKLP